MRRSAQMGIKMDIVVNEPKTARGLKTFNAICDAADELFYKKGYHETSITDITLKADVALGTFYVYFKDKLSAYTYLLNRYSIEIRQIIRESLTGAADRRVKERNGILKFVEYIRQKPNAYYIIWNAIYIEPKLFENYYDEFSKHYSQGLHRSMEKGEVIEVDEMVLSYMLIGITNFLGLKYGIFEKDVPFEPIIDTIMMVLENGMFKK